MLWMLGVLACGSVSDPEGPERREPTSSQGLDSGSCCPVTLDSTPSTPSGSTPTTGEPPDTGETADTGQPAPLPNVAAVFDVQPVPCAEPGLRTSEGPLEVIPLGAHPVSTRHVWGGGLAGGDFDGDGAFEVVIATESGLEWREWDGTTLAVNDRVPKADLSMAVGATPADVDGDGDLDLLVTRWEARNRLLRNDGGVFVDATEGSGLRDEAMWTVSAALADADGDGDLDLAIGNYGETPWFGVDRGQPSRLYLGNGDGTFTDVSERIAGWGEGWTFLLEWQDIDHDRLPELLVLNDNASIAPSLVLHNRGGTFVDAPGVSFFPGYDSMGQGVGDIDHDGAPDFVQTTFAWPELRESEPGPSSLGVQWIDVARARGLVHDSNRGQYFGWGTDLVDLDHDGDLDVPMVYGYWDTFPVASQSQPEEDGYFDALFLAEDGAYADAAEAWGFDSYDAGRGLLVADVDGDGWLDMVKRQLDAPDLLYRARCGEAAGLGVRLRMSGPNTHAVGAEVRATVGGLTRTRWVGAGSTSLFTGAPPEAWLGLGEALEAELTVVWPDGMVSTQVVPTRSLVEVRRE